MRFTPQFLDELRARLPVSEVVGRRVKLRKAGREWKGLSPFNKEKTPSFFVNDQKQAWFDFSSGKNGNIFDFLMLTEGVSFPEAVERLANDGRRGAAGLFAARRKRAKSGARRCTTSSSLPRNSSKRRWRHATARAAAAISPTAALIVGDAAEIPPRLCDRRAYALKEHLGAAKIPVEDMVEAGLMVAGEDIPVPYDRFRDRMMFPISDWRGRVIAFGGRALEKEVAGEIPQFAGDAALPQRRHALQHRRRRARPRMTARG